MKRKITFLLSALCTVMLITQSFTSMGQTIFKRVSSNILSDGDEIIFVNQGETYACGTQQNDNNRTPVAISTSNHKYTYSYDANADNNVQIFTVKTATINNSTKYGFHTGNGYIYSASNSKNYLKTNSTAATTAPSGTAAWSLSVSNSGVFSFTNVSNTSYYLAFNGTDYFSQYKQGQSKPYVYEKAYAVTYNAGGGSGTMSDSNSPYASGETVTLMENTFSKDGYDFNGWVVKDASLNTIAVTNNTFTMPRSAVTITAQWTPATTGPYFEADDVEIAATATGGTIYYVVNNSVTGGKVGASITAGEAWIKTVTVTNENSDDNTVTFTADANTIGQREGTIHLTYTYDTKETKTIDVTITQLTSTYTVTYNANYGTVDPIIDGPFNYNTSVSAKAANTFTAPSDKAFGSWNTQADGNGTNYAAGATITNGITSNINLYAKWLDMTTYTLVTSSSDFVPGAHYVLASSKTKDATAYVMDSQHNSDYRYTKTATIQKGVGANDFYIEALGLYEFVISGDNNNKYTIYDEGNNGFLQNDPNNTGNLNANATALSNAAKWTISISSGEATIRNVGDNSKYLKYNYNNGSPRYKNYANSANNIYHGYLYIKAGDSDIKYYSPTAISEEDPNIDITPITVLNNEILTLTGDITCTDAANLIIEDGGQLITNSSIPLTYKKQITSATKDGGWYTISTPVHTPSNTFLEHESVENLILASEQYDFFYYDEPSNYWRNYKKHEFDLNVSQGYLYRNNGAELHFAGYNNQATYYEIALSYASAEPSLLGFNLIGNPYPQNITMSDVTVNNEGTLTGGYVLSNAGAWSAEVAATIAPAQGFLVQIDKAGVTARITKPTGGSKSRANHDYLKFIVANSQYEDAAYALFDKGYGLNKIDHRNADIPMLYVLKDKQNFAIATMSDDTKSFNLNFKAMTTGKYTLSYKADGNFSYLHVIDRLTGEDVDMLLEGEYSFIASPIDSENRFIVRLEYSAGSEISESSIFAYQSGNDIIVNGEGELQIFDMMGRRVLTQYVSGVETINLQLNGVYIFRLNEKTQKIVVK